MKLTTIIFSLIILFGFYTSTSAQFDFGKKIKKKIERKAEKETDKAIDKGIDGAVDAVKNEKKEENEDKESVKKVNNKKADTEDVKESPVKTEKAKDLKLWSKYDFVRGDKVIFEDDLSGEESGEFPSRWDLISGSAENASLGNDNVIHLTHNNSIITPLMNKKDFLPDVFTIEFDLYFEKLAVKRSDFYKIRLYEGQNSAITLNGKKIYPIEISWNKVKMGSLGGQTESFNKERKDWEGKWKHIALSFNQRSLKLYMDEERMLNIPNLGFKPKNFSIGANFDARFIKMSSIKNIRIYEGGKKLYDRIMAEGKFITHGILFEVNKAEITPESMGTINEIVNLMKEHPDLKFSIEGHTDSDGEESFNQKLSEDRAEAVKVVLVDLGIDPSRLQAKGWGETKPLTGNSTPEEKANNRRVEFIKI